MSTRTGYVYTIWPPSQELEIATAFLKSFATRLEGAVKQKEVAFYSMQLERSADTSRLHFQTYIEYSRNSKGQAINKLLGIKNSDYHGEPRRGTPVQAFEYTQKDDTHVGHGNRFSGGILPLAEQGARNDLVEVYEILKTDGARGLKRCLESCPAATMRYARGLQFALSILDEPRPVYVQRDVRVIVGNTGAGKTKLALEQAHLRSPGSVCILPAPSEAAWLDGYRGHEVVILDDYAPSSRYPHAVLLRMLDGYEYPAPVKGGFIVFRPHSIFITTNFHPYEWYPNGDYPALRRRITSCQLLGLGQNFDGKKPRDFWGSPLEGALPVRRLDVVPQSDGAQPTV